MTSQLDAARTEDGLRARHLQEPYIDVPEGLPGIEALVAFKPSSGEKVMQLVHELLRGGSGLSPAEREMIAGFISSRNGCAFCSQVHTATAARLLDGDRDTVCAVTDAGDASGIDEKMQALLTLAGKVQRSGSAVSADDIARARAVGATDEDIHDAVLVAAAFCMVNRYVDGLAAPTPADQGSYEHISAVVAAHGYAPC